MFKAGKNLEDEQFFLRFNSIPNAGDAIVNDAKYHVTC